MRKCRLKSCGQRLPALKECENAYQKHNYCDAECWWKDEETRKQKYLRAKEKPSNPPKAKKKPKTLAKLRNEAAELLQKLVRLKAADSNGYVRCVTCGKRLHWKSAQGGHFLERGRNRTKLIEENIHPQDPACNLYGMKNASTVLAYRRYMVEMYGEKFVTWLEMEAKKPCTKKRAELEALKAELKARVAELEQNAA